MKMAEALQERSDINKRISELRRRLENCLLVQEGEEPAEDPMDLLNELDSSTERLETLVASINETNCNTKVDGMSLTELIARKDALTLRHSAYKELVYTAGNNTYRARGTEIKVKAVIKAAELQKTVDSLAKEIRKLDNKLQETNWKTELVEKYRLCFPKGRCYLTIEQTVTLQGAYQAATAEVATQRNLPYVAPGHALTNSSLPAPSCTSVP